MKAKLIIKFVTSVQKIMLTLVILFAIVFCKDIFIKDCYAQVSSEDIDSVFYDTRTVYTVLDSPIRQFTNVTAISNYNYRCKIYSSINKHDSLIATIGPYDTVGLQIDSIEQLIFAYIVDSNEVNYITKEDTFKVEPNKFFTYKIYNDRMSSKNKILKDFVGKQLYSIKIEDEDYKDVSQFVVVPYRDAEEYIDIVPSGQLTYIVKLKNSKKSFDMFVEKLKIKNKLYLEIGIEIIDEVTGQSKTYPQKIRFKDYD